MSITFTRLFALPDEILQEGVLSQLSWQELARLDEALNNRRLRNQYHNLLPTLSMDYALSPSTPLSFLRWVKTRGMHMDSLCIGWEAGDSALKVWQESGVQVEHYKQIYCRHIAQQATADLIGTSHMLRSVDVHGSWDVLDTALWAEAIRNCPNLIAISLITKGSIDNYLIAAITTNCTQLEELVLAKCTGLNDASIVLLTERIASLHTLRLKGCAHLTDITLQALGLRCRKLSNLSLHANSGCVTDTGTVCLLQGCSCLKFLELWDCSNITAASITALSPLCAELLELKLPRCSVFGDPAVAPVMSRLRSLYSLDLSRGVNISADVLVAIFENTPELRFVELAYVVAVTHEVLSVLVQSCPLLQLLNISGCLHVTDLSVLAPCSQLENLLIDDCEGVTDVDLIQLVFACSSLAFVSAERSGVTAATTRQTLDAIGCVLLYKPEIHL